MPVRRSTALRNKLASGMPVHEALAGGRIYGYSGAQPATADAAPTGTNLIIYTKDGAAFTPPVQSRAKITIVGVAGSLDTIKVGGSIPLIGAAVASTGATDTTATAVAAAINAYYNPLGIIATASGADVTLYAPFSLGAVADGLTLAITQTTLTSTVNGGSSLTFGGSGSPGAGTTQVNGLGFTFPPVDGVLSKDANAWKGTVLATGTIGYFRYVAGGSAAAADSTTDVRFDGSVAVSGANLNLPSTAFVVGAIKTIDSFPITLPVE